MCVCVEFILVCVRVCVRGQGESEDRSGSDGRVPEHGGLCGVGGRTVLLAPIALPPAGQDGHAVLLTQVPVGPLSGLDLPAQTALLLYHVHHGAVSIRPRHGWDLGGGGGGEGGGGGGGEGEGAHIGIVPGSL